MYKMLIFIVGVLFFTSVFADNYYLDHAKGWHWYDDPKEESVEESDNENVSQSTPIEKMDKVKKELKTSLDQAILTPSEENVTKYITIQNQLSRQSNQFAETWQQVLIKHPELNFSLEHPTNGVALQVYNEEQGKKYDRVIDAFSKETGLFFFYRSTCPYCKKFAPILKNFAARYGITIIAITMDGISLPEFPDSRTDNGQAAQFHVTVEPSLFAVNPYTQKAYPVAYGLTSETELRENIYKIVLGQKGLTS